MKAGKFIGGVPYSWEEIYELTGCCREDFLYDTSGECYILLIEAIEAIEAEKGEEEMGKVLVDRELKPCPFCGGKPRLDQRVTQSLWNSGDATFSNVSCDECDVTGQDFCDHPSGEEAIEWWNRRSQPAEAEGVDFGFDDRSVKVSQEAYSIFMERERHHLAEVKELRVLLSKSLPIVEAHAGASHMLEGFRSKRNKWDELVDEIRAALTAKGVDKI